MSPDLSSMIYNRLKSSDALASTLSTFKGLPAIFYQTAPDDQQAGWGRETQYPRIVFDLDEQANAERKSSGTLVVFVYCDRAGTEPEEIEPLVKARMIDLLIKPSGGFPYCFAWARTDAFEIEGVGGGAAKRRVIGLEIRFDIVEYPPQETTDPDPVAALNAFLLETYPDVLVLGLSPLGEYTETDADHPVVYCRLRSVENESITNTVAWMNARIAIHVICSDAETRLKIAADLCNLLLWKAEIIMLDGSPMRPTGVNMSNTADYLKEGQLSGVFHYGVLRWRATPPRLNHVYTDLHTAG